MKTETLYQLVHIEGDVEPDLLDTYHDRESLLRDARALRRQFADDGIYYLVLDEQGRPISMEAFTGGVLDEELPEDPPGETLVPEGDETRFNPLESLRR